MPVTHAPQSCRLRNALGWSAPLITSRHSAKLRVQLPRSRDIYRALACAYPAALLADGFAWNGKTYASLSKVALAITGTRWNGPKFFGLRDKPSKGSTT